MPTYIPKVDENGREWFVIDAKDQVLGKLATRAATILTGKHKPAYTPFLDTGDHVIVINAAQVHLSVRKKHPTRLVEEAVRGMLPKTKLGRAMFHKLKVYAGDVHPHQAQKPKTVALAAR
jgi:large subunit ribosomal protein L13